MKRTNFKGFTIVELVIVISVIAILASISVVAYNGVQNRARSAGIISGIRNIERAFQLAAADSNSSTWQLDTTYTGGNNPSIAQIIGANPTFSSYLQNEPRVPGLTSTWTYDNDGDSRSTSPSNCDALWTGVVLAISGVNEELIRNVNNSLDTDSATDTLLQCGKVRSSAAKDTLIYQLGFTQQIGY